LERSKVNLIDDYVSPFSQNGMPTYYLLFDFTAKRYLHFSYFLNFPGLPDASHLCPSSMMMMDFAKVAIDPLRAIRDAKQLVSATPLIESAGALADVLQDTLPSVPLVVEEVRSRARRFMQAGGRVVASSSDLDCIVS